VLAFAVPIRKINLSVATTEVILSSDYVNVHVRGKVRSRAEGV